MEIHLDMGWSLHRGRTGDPAVRSLSITKENAASSPACSKPFAGQESSTAADTTANCAASHFVERDAA